MWPTLFICSATFSREDEHYLASSQAYGDLGLQGLNNALDLFLEHPGARFCLDGLRREWGRGDLCGVLCDLDVDGMRSWRSSMMFP